MPAAKPLYVNAFLELGHGERIWKLGPPPGLQKPTNLQ